MKAYFTQRINIDKRHPAVFDYLSGICEGFRAMYNCANFHIRQHMTGLRKSVHARQPNEQESIDYVRTGIDRINAHYESGGKTKRFPYPDPEQWFPGYYVLEAVFKMQENEDYRQLPAQVSQKAIRQCVADWQAFFLAQKAYRAAPERFTGKPSIPKYKKQSLTTAVFTNQACLLKRDKHGQVSLKFPGTKVKLDLGRFPTSKTGCLKEVKVVPIHQVLEVHILMETDMEMREPSGVPDRCISIDPGVENFAAIANNIGKPPILVRGNVMKSRNWWFNRQIAAAESKEMVRIKDSRKYAPSRRIHRLELRRQRFFRDYFHKITKRLMDYCGENRIDTIVVGKNDGWKQKVTMGTVNNRNFVRIPYEMFLKQLSYKAERQGIRVVLQEESYTSKASFLDDDPLPEYSKEEYIYAFSGKRICRGLYAASTGEVLHSDINGACNILKKALPKAFCDIENFRYLKNPVSWRYEDWYLPEQKRQEHGLQLQCAA